MNEKLEPRRKPYEKPEVATYDPAELVPDTVFTQNNGSNSGIHSDRRLKRNIRPVHSKRILNQLTRI